MDLGEPGLLWYGGNKNASYYLFRVSSANRACAPLIGFATMPPIRGSLMEKTVSATAEVWREQIAAQQAGGQSIRAIW
jgi:hypothetical protein